MTCIFLCTKIWLARKPVSLFCRGTSGRYLQISATIHLVPQKFKIILLISSILVQIPWTNLNLSAYSSFVIVGWTLSLLLVQLLLPAAIITVLHLQSQLCFCGKKSKQSRVIWKMLYIPKKQCTNWICFERASQEVHRTRLLQKNYGDRWYKSAGTCLSRISCVEDWFNFTEKGWKNYLW